ncbi:hypothetical protein HPO96_31815 [Kribbella sandramycini]|uniref:Uncharacterized protein n=1 Tax=Kribbella sandramycini TaxID=60450 RepID=A0A7Y4L5U1_9ACTN|nr:hypothetical protein [Kribbella sandramycini]MBB6567131.1 hypothetical protein [Kribbella sandramycini]NOL44848.1 hypothetical protein [Kribbella sandramycini]
MLGLSSYGLRFGPPNALTVTVVIGLIALLVGVVGVLLTNRRVAAARAKLPPPHLAPPPQQPHGIPPAQPPYGQPQFGQPVGQPQFGGPPPPQSGYGVPPAQPPFGQPQFAGPPPPFVPPGPPRPLTSPELQRAQLLRGFAIATLIAGILAMGVHYDVRLDGRIAIPEVAGGIPRVPTPPAVEADAQRQLRNGSSLKYGTYEHPKYKGVRGPEASVMVFYGLEGNQQPSATFDRAFVALGKKGKLLNGVSDHPGGRGNETIRCASLQGPGFVEAHCFWADATTFGHLFATEITEPELAELLARMRPDLEPTA